MKVVGRDKIDALKRNHADAGPPLDAWTREVKKARWRNPHDLKRDFPKASLLGDKRVIFNIGGNRYRLEARVNYPTETVLVVRIGTHADYDTWDL